MTGDGLARRQPDALSPLQVADRQGGTRDSVAVTGRSAVVPDRRATRAWSDRR
jgi:hypothetical protein